MANSEHLAKLNEGVAAWNLWRTQNPHANPDFRDANLTEYDLDRVDFSRTSLWGTTLSGAYLRDAVLAKAYMARVDLQDADLGRANLVGAQLSEGYLRGARLRGADLRDADLRDADLTEADLAQANLSGANLSGATLVDTNFEGADLSGCSVYGISAWNVKLGGAVQSNLVITRPNESPVEVDNLEVAQFIYLLLHNEKIRDVIDTIGKKAVLILGRFTAERKAVLDAIREALRHQGYLPILFDFDKPGARDTHETIVTLASMARFIIADITDPKSIPQELGSIVPTLPSVPVQPVLQTGCEPWGMYDHIRRYPWVLPVVCYENERALIAALRPRVIEPAEQKATEQRPS